MVAEKYEGKVFITQQHGELVVLDYEKYSKVRVKFLKTGYETVTTMGCVKRGLVKDKLSPLKVTGGFLGEVSTKNKCGDSLEEYIKWVNMMHRCYGGKNFEYCPTYKDCKVSDNFKDFTYFKQWCNKQIGFGNEGWHLDKDILVKGNRVYSEDTCCFVPKEINLLFGKSTKCRGDCPIGVHFNKREGVFEAYTTCYKKRKHLGKFKTSEEAFQVYKQAKESYIKEVANKWKDQIDHRVYEALLAWTVDITD